MTALSITTAPGVAFLFPEPTSGTKAGTDGENQPKDAPRRIRPYDPARDLAAVLSIYAAKSSGQRGRLARQAEGWWGFRLGSAFGRGVDVKVLVEGAPDEEDVIVPEVEAVDGRGLRLILAHLAELAIERRLGQITFFIHPESDMARLLRFFGADVTITYNFDRGSMVRVINLASTLQKLTPVLEQRLASALGTKEAGNARLVIAIGDANSARPDLAAAARPPAEAFQADAEAAANAIAGTAAGAHATPGLQAVLIQGTSDGLKVTALAEQETVEFVTLREAVAGVPVLALPQELFTQLLFGYRPAADILSEPSVRVTPRLTPMIAALFPAGLPYMPRVDRF